MSPEMAKTKKPRYEWFRRTHWSGPLVCENGDDILSIYPYGPRPLVSCSIHVAYLETTQEEVWQNGRRIGVSGSGWRYRLCAYVGTGFGMIHLAGRDGPILSNSQAFGSSTDAIRGALHELITGCDEQLLVLSDSSRPYWGKSQGRYFSRPGSEQLAYYLCLPEWEPVWQLVDEVTRHDNWLAEVRAPKKSAFTEQLQLF